MLQTIFKLECREDHLSAGRPLLLVLHWLCDLPKLQNLALLFGVDKSTVSHLISKVLPKIYVSVHHLSPISFPPTIKPHEFEAVIGAIACTSHLWWRVHPCQADWYRGDKHAFSITAQVKNYSS